jgi:hypothetical protein
MFCALKAPSGLLSAYPYSYTQFLAPLAVLGVLGDETAHILETTADVHVACRILVSLSTLLKSPTALCSLCGCHIVLNA